MDIVYERPPLAYPAALRALAGCCASTARLLRQHRLRLPARWVGTQLRFADGTSARVYRETVADRGTTLDPCVLVVEFRLRAVRGLGHAAFRRESLLNTPLFAASPGSYRSCGWPTTNAAATGACTSGMTRAWPRTTRAPCGGCSPWCRCPARSTTWCCPGCAATRCWTSRTCWAGTTPGGG